VKPQGAIRFNSFFHLPDSKSPAVWLHSFLVNPITNRYQKEAVSAPFCTRCSSTGNLQLQIGIFEFYRTDHDKEDTERDYFIQQTIRNLSAIVNVFIMQGHDRIKTPI